MIPKRVMDGSEPGESAAAAVLSGAPVELQARTVRYMLPLPLRNRNVPHHCLPVIREPILFCYNLCLSCMLGYTAPQKPRLNLATGTGIIGVWTGTSYTKVTDGRTP